ncbi:MULTISPECIES: hypothetical protein [Clostridia]|jgi:predicted  nucleic acid-binding Zn-ribbon protein|uniref:hypothetical protein n=1 Tax=Clostridia TaxID=186801 RepID=UPI000AC88F6C|nr:MULTISPECIES: hypothetical protein [Clostridia]MBW4847811.1 hypothetical protein [Lachnospiraceae bacterium]
MTDNELLQAIYKDTQELKSRLNSIENNVTDLQLTLENEIRQIKEKINVIA